MFSFRIIRQFSCFIIQMLINSLFHTRLERFLEMELSKKFMLLLQTETVLFKCDCI